MLWKVAQKLPPTRGKPDINRVDYNFYVDWDTGPDGHVTVVPRMRGSPVDKLVSELMILVNNTWGKVLVGRARAGLYRTQSGGKVKMSTRPGEHQGLGLAHYLWASSPLRRYSDLVNQRQLLAVLANEKPPYARQRRRAVRRADRFRGDLLAVRRVPGPDRALLVPALAAAGEGQRDDGHRDPRQSRALRAVAARRAACRPARRSRRRRRCGSRSGASTSWRRRSNAATPATGRRVDAADRAAHAFRGPEARLQ